MLFPSFEIAIRADLIKPVCIIEVFREMLTGSRYSHSVETSHQKHREFWDTRGVMAENFAEDVNQTLTACVCWCCLIACRKQSCIYQNSVHTYFKTVAHLSLSRSVLVCLSSDLAYNECILLYISHLGFQVSVCELFLYPPYLAALLIINTVERNCC